MRSLLRFLMVILLLVSSAAAAADERIPVRVLYCGNPGSQREADYHSFLERHFSKVTCRNLNAFKETNADGHDVVIFDWTNGYDGAGEIDFDKWDTLNAPFLTRKFLRPTILIGRAGGQIAARLNLKIDWLCLCLDGPAHHLRLDHPVFRSPLAVDPKLDDYPTPRDYPGLTIDRSLGQTMKVWHVQTKNYPNVDPGLVSTLYGFDDSPDAEVIAQGVAGKGPDTVSLGRHANFFLWGFSAPPADMSPAAQRLFVNVICYMRQFDGSRPLVRNVQRSREWALRYAMMGQKLSEAERRHDIERFHAALKRHPELVPKNRQRDLDTFVTEQVDLQQKSQRDAFERLVSASIRKQLGNDEDRLVEYFRANLEYVRPDGEGFVIDDDVKSLGVSNRSVKLLERCVSMLEHSDGSEPARRLLTRYTDEAFQSPHEWSAWLKENRDRLFFSDVGGFKFFVRPSSKHTETGH